MTGVAGRNFCGRVVLPALHQGTVMNRPLLPLVEQVDHLGNY